MAMFQVSSIKIRILDEIYLQSTQNMTWMLENNFHQSITLHILHRDDFNTRYLNLKLKKNNSEMQHNTCENKKHDMSEKMII